MAMERRAPSPGLLNGPVNLVSPNPVTNADFTKTLARILQRPAILPVPAFVLSLGFGEFAVEGLLASARLVPQKLIQSGFVFQHPDLYGAIESLLTQPPNPMSS